MRRATLGGLVAGLVVMASGCAGMRAAVAKQNHLDQKTREFVYEKPAADLFAEASAYLTELGYPVSSTDDSFGGTTTSVEDGGERTWYALKVVPVSETTSTITLQKFMERPASNFNIDSRDLKAEFELLKRVNPEQASAIEAEATAKEQEALNG